MPSIDCIENAPADDVGLQRAREVLRWVRAFPEAYVHPCIQVHRDQWGGIGLFLANKQEHEPPDSSRKHEQDPESEPEGRHAVSSDRPHLSPLLGERDEEATLLVLPRSLMIEWHGSSSGGGGVDITTGKSRLEGEGEREGRQQGGGGGAEKMIGPFASLAVTLLREVSVGSSSPWATYLACLPSPEALASFMPLMWHLEELESAAPAPLLRMPSSPGDSAEGLPAVSSEALTASRVSKEGPPPPLCTPATFPSSSSFIPPEHGSWEARYLRDAVSQDEGEESGGDRKPITLVRQLLSASPSALRTFDKLWADVIREYRQLSTTSAGPSPGFVVKSFRDYVWARCIVSSRAMHLWQGPTLVPLGDFLNHHMPPTVVCRCRTDTPPPKHSIYSPPSSSASEDSEVSTSESSSSDDGSTGEVPASRIKVRGTAVQFFVCEAIGDRLQPATAAISGSCPHHQEGSRPPPGREECTWTYNSHDQDAAWLMGYGFIPDDGNKTSRPTFGAEQTEQQHGDEGGEFTLRQRVRAIDEALARIRGEQTTSTSGLICVGYPESLGSRAEGIRVLLERERSEVVKCLERQKILVGTEVGT